MDVTLIVMVVVATTGTNVTTITGIRHGIIRGIVSVAVAIKRIKMSAKKFAAQR